jgi:hypothetical protein
LFSLTAVRARPRKKASVDSIFEEDADEVVA